MEIMTYLREKIGGICIGQGVFTRRTLIHLSIILGFFIVLLIVFIAMPKNAKAEHSASINVYDYSDNDRILSINTTVVVAVNITNNGPYEISFIQFTMPQGFIINGWSTIDAPESNGTTWLDNPDVDGSDEPTTGGNATPAAPRLLLTAFNNANITAGDYELFILYIDTKNSSRNILQITIDTWDNATYQNTYTVYVAAISTDGPYDICVDVRSWDGNVVNVSMAKMLLPQSYLNHGNEGMNTSFKMFPDYHNNSDAFASAPIIQNGLVLWRDGYEFYSNFTSTTYNITWESWGDDAYIYIVPQDNEKYSPIKINYSNFTRGNNGFKAYIDGILTTYSDALYNVLSVYFSPSTSAYHNVYIQVTGFAGGNNVNGTAYYILMPHNNTAIFQCIEIAPGRGIYRGGTFDLSSGSWPDIGDNSSLRIEIDLNGDDTYIITYIYIDAVAPLIENVAVERNPYVWQAVDGTIWYQNNMTQWGITGYVNISFEINESHPMKVTGTYAFGELPMGTISVDYAKVSYAIESIDEDAASITVYIYDMAGNIATYSFTCSKDNTPPQLPLVVGIEEVPPSPYVFEDLNTNTIYYRSNVPNLNVQINIHILNITDNIGGCGFWKVTGSESFNGSAVDSDRSDGLMLIYLITTNSIGHDITITAYDMVSNNISITLPVIKDDVAPVVDYFWISEDSEYIYFDNHTYPYILYYSNDQPMNEVITIWLHARDEPFGGFIGLYYANGSSAFRDPGPTDSLYMHYINEYTFHLNYIISTNETAPGSVIYIRVYDYLMNYIQFEIPAIVDNEPPVSVALRDFSESSPYIFFKEDVMYYSNDQTMNDIIEINITAYDTGSGLSYGRGTEAFNMTNPSSNVIYDDTYGVGGFTFRYLVDTYEYAYGPLVFYIFDHVGNYETYTINIVLDNEPPITYDNAPVDWVSDIVMVTLYETDNSGGVGVMKTYYTINGSDPTTMSDVYSTPIVFHETGIYTVRYFSVDFVGNTQQIQVTPEIKVDLIYPQITSIIIDPDDLNSSYVGPFTVSINVIDYGGSGIDPNKVMYDFHFTNDNYTGYKVMTRVSLTQYYFAISYDWWAYANMKIYWKISIRDVAGNYYNSSEYVEYIEYIPPPNHKPIVEVLSPEGYEYWTGVRYVRWYAEDPDGDELRFDIWISWDGGISYVLLQEGLANDFRYWPLNTTTLTHSQGEPVYKIKVIAREIYTEDKLQAEDESELFSIYHPKAGEDHPPELQIIYPLGGEKITAPTEVRWHAFDPEGHEMEFEVYVLIIHENGLMDKYSIGTYASYVRSTILYPDAFQNGSSYRIWIKCKQLTGDRTWLVEAMTMPFEIYHPGILENHPPTVTLNPLDKSSYRIDEDSIRITWTAQDQDGGDNDRLKVSIYISYDAGRSYTLIEENIDASDAMYEIPLQSGGLATASNYCRIKIEVSDGKSYGTTTAISEIFSILPSRGPDWDLDGMPNWWEEQFNLDPKDSNDANFDKDGDGLINLLEYQKNTDPTDPDTDDDGMEDGWEIENRLNPLSPSDAFVDYDGDGFENLYEYLNHTDPWNPNDHPPIVTTLNQVQKGESDGGWLLVTILALVVTIVLMFGLYITKPMPWEEETIAEREVEEWIEKLRRGPPRVREIGKRKVVKQKKLKKKKVHPIKEKEKELLKEEEKEKKRGYVIIPEDTVVDVYIKERAFEKMARHCFDFADERKEVMGLLIGDRYKWNGKEYIIVNDVVTTDLDSSAVHVRFNRDGFESLFEDLDKLPRDYVIVGWYHSHPGHTCFLSSTDIRTQEAMFNQPFHTAIVIDPINIQMKAFGVENGKAYEKSFAILRRRFK